MIPFQNAWPYETVMGDLYVSTCPFCDAENVLLPLKPKELPEIHDGKKRLLVFPCCHNKITLIDADQDYLLSDGPLSKRMV
ncbi:hypothetical protein I6N90_06590 [Paenibacillus sp. GSMTC-2017]|uniref:hypothetical protein n=1 Tax=Paenibacillus sp. GSMTC-2017 TaxID=2794350 RepID=UPI0018D5B6A9|nr:hypothetical protein [Paenibacillus sp. GSMTC-2017]MBH5317482.1 hypothetical protein [Paenibacillus sp. GSMTC-2017]